MYLNLFSLHSSIRFESYLSFCSSILEDGMASLPILRPVTLMIVSKTILNTRGLWSSVG